MKGTSASPILIPALALLLLAAAFVGYQVVSAQTSRDELGDDGPDAPTGLTGTNDGVGVLLAWDDPDDDSIVGYRVWRRYHRDGHEDADRDPVDDELQLHVADRRVPPHRNVETSLIGGVHRNRQVRQ